MEIARDIGLETLTQEGGIEHLVERIKSHVSPEHNMKPRNFSGQAKRQVGSYPDTQEPMLSYTQRRRRWWRVLH